MTQYPANYPPPPFTGSPPRPPKAKNGMGVAALAVAMFGLLASISIVGGIVCGIVAIILGFSGRRLARQGAATNREVATAGIALGALAIVVSLAVIGIWVRGYQEVDFGSYVDCLSKNSDQQHVQKCADEFRQRVNDEFGLK
jgi:hypothetical protein